MQAAEEETSPSELYVQSLPAPVQARVKHLNTLQDKYDNLASEFEKEIDALEAKYAALYGMLSSSGAAALDN